MKTLSSIALGLSVILGSALGGTGAALAEFPERAVQIIVPVGTGGGNDIIARVIAAQLQKKWGKPVVVVNKPGGGTALAEGFVATSPADGHTILIEGIARTINVAANAKDAGYDPVNGLAAVTQIGKQPYVLLASKKSGAKTLPELIALAKERPGKLNYADSGPGTNNDLAMRRLMARTGTQMFEISYKALAEVLVALIGGEIDVAFSDLLSATPHIKDGKVVPLAVTDDTRTPVFPNIPTAGEALGGEQIVYTAWFGVFVAAGTPKDIVNKLNEDIVAAIRLPEIADKMAGDGFMIIGSKPDDYEKILKAEAAAWRTVMDTMQAK